MEKNFLKKGCVNELFLSIRNKKKCRLAKQEWKSKWNLRNLHRDMRDDDPPNDLKEIMQGFEKFNESLLHTSRWNCEIQTCDRSVVRIRLRKKLISLHADFFLKKSMCQWIIS